MKVQCSSCGAKLNAPAKLFGKTVSCPKCKSKLHVPRPQEDSVKQQTQIKGRPAPSKSRGKKVSCSGCHAKLTAPPKLFGKTVKCPRCKTPISIPIIESKSTVDSKPVSRESAPATASLQQDSVESHTGANVASPTNPSAGSDSKSKNDKVSPSTSSRRPLWIGLAAIVSFVAVGTAVYLMFFSGGSSGENANKQNGLKVVSKPVQRPELIGPGQTNDPSGEVKKEPDKQVESKIVNQPVVPRKKVAHWLLPLRTMPTGLAPVAGPLVNRWRPGHELGYRIKIKASEEGGVIEHSGALLLETGQLASKTSRSDRPRKFHPTVEYGSGLGVPGGYIVTGLELVEGEGAVVEVVIDGEIYPAEVNQRVAEPGVAILKIENRDFPRIPLDRLTYPSGWATLAWRTPNGDLAMEDLKTSFRDTGLAISSHSVGGVLVKGWEGISGMIVSHQDRSAESVKGMHVPLAQVASAKIKVKRNWFTDEFSTDYLKRDQLKSKLEKRVVQVIVRREASSNDARSMGFQSRLYSPAFPSRPFQSRSIEIDKKALAFHPRLNESWPAVLRIDSDSNLVEHPDHRDRDDVRGLPYFLGNPFLIPRIHFPSDSQSTWSVENRVALRNRLEEVKGRVQFMYSDFEFVYSDSQWSKVLAENRARRIENYEVLGQSGGIAYIRRIVVLKSESDEASEASQRVVAGVPIELRGEELIEFDIEYGVLLASRFRGSLTTQNRKIEIDCDFEIMKSQDRLAAKPVWRSQETGCFPIDSIDVEAVFSALESSSNTDKENAVKVICDVKPDRNSKIGNFIGANYSRFSNIRKTSLTGWIPTRYFDSLPQTNNSSFAVEFLFKSPPVAEAVDFMKREFMDQKDVANVLMTRYPSIIDELTLDKTKNLKRFSSKEEVLLNLLSVGGSVDAIPVLERLKGVITNDRMNTATDARTIRRVDSIIARIRERNGQ